MRLISSVLAPSFNDDDGGMCYRCINGVTNGAAMGVLWVVLCEHMVAVVAVTLVT